MKRKLKSRLVPEGFTRMHSEDFEDVPARSLEDLLRDSCGKLILLILKEVKRQTITGDAQNFNAFADCLIETGHKIKIEIRGELPDETFLVESLFVNDDGVKH